MSQKPSARARTRQPIIRGRAQWPLWSLIPIGFGAWAPIYAGINARRRSWVLWGVLWCLFVVAGFVLDATGGHSGSDNLAGYSFVVGWIGAAVTSFTIRSSYEEAVASPEEAAVRRGQQALAERRQALQLARDKPELALEMGVGRPDVPGSTDMGVVDVNHAGVGAMLKLPGVNGTLATKIVATRERVNGFSSLEDMGTVMDLDGDIVEQLRGHVVCLPRAGTA